MKPDAPPNGAKRGPRIQSGQRVTLLPAPKIPLNSLEDIRREAARVYREARAGKLDTAEASKLSFMLQGLAKMVEGTSIERRITALELGDDSGGSEYDDSTDSQHDVIDAEVKEVRP